jgi:monoamine oxidase
MTSKNNQNNQVVFDCVVIGGGVSGLRAALALHEAGVNYLVLEASRIVGGRLRQAREDFVPGTHSGRCE